MKQDFLKELKKINKQISKLYAERNTVKEELLQYRISVGDYISEEDMKQMPDQRLWNIDAILDSNFQEVYIPEEKGVYIESGRLYCSSYENGLLYYSDKENCYIYRYHYHEETKDIKYIYY